jgi:pimeloyl-ACP methyl ester carboxylesterase
MRSGAAHTPAGAATQRRPARITAPRGPAGTATPRHPAGAGAVAADRMALATGSRSSAVATVTDPRRALLLSGLAGSPAAWAPFAARAQARLELWDGHLPWSGDSDSAWSHGADPANWVRAAVRDSAERSGGTPDVLLAHSFAANIVLELLARGELADVRAVVLVSPFYRPEPERFDWATIAYYLEGFHRILDEGLRVGSGNRISADIREAMALQVRERVGPYGWMRFFDLYLRTPFLDTAAVRTPLLVITGDRDFAAGAQDARSLAAALPDARCEVFDGCGHFAMAEQPDRFADAVQDFLTTIDNPVPTTTRS